MKRIIFFLAVAALSSCATQEHLSTQIPKHQCKYIIPDSDLLPKCGDCEPEKVCVICERWKNRVLGPQFYQYAQPDEAKIHIRQISESTKSKK